MKALSLWQPWATLCVLPGWKADNTGMVQTDPAHMVPEQYMAPAEKLAVKRIETRSWQAPHSLIGQTIAIHAAKRRPQDIYPQVRVGHGDGRPDSPWSMTLDGDRYPLPLGAVVGTVRLLDCVPMLDQSLGGLAASTLVPSRRLIIAPSGLFCSWVGGSASPWYDVSDQAPFGWFETGRFAWLFDDATMFDEPIPTVGRQGLWEWRG